MAKILILIIGHLCNAPRPQKEAETLAQAGHDVTVGGIWFDPELIERDRQLINNRKWQFIPIIDFNPSNKWNNFLIRGKARIARELYQNFGYFSPELLGYGVREMLTFARKTRADLTIVHSEGGLWVGRQLLKEEFKVGVDFEDWFSEDLLPEARKTRPIPQLKALESQLIKQCSYCLTTSQVMANALAEAYQTPKPTVIYNAFPLKEREQIDGQFFDRRNRDIPSLHWFSQTIGEGRGLEVLLQSLIHIQHPVEIHLRGNYPESSRQWLEPLIPANWKESIFIHPTVPNSQLLSRIAEHDTGLALEIPYCFNKQYTISNKLFQYLQGGLAVIATDTEGQKEVFSQAPDIGEVVPHGDSLALAQAINNLLGDRTKLNRAKASALKAFQETFCWEKQNNFILNIIDGII
ncbi:glycosyltransferase [Synechocystis salina LEGE 06155]|nr:glycosyltransferase [Synechocystis salina LEGE 06155]